MKFGNNFDNYLNVVEAIEKATTFGTKNREALKEMHDKNHELIAELKKEEAVRTLKLPIDGNDIQKALNINPGPVIKSILDCIREAVCKNPQLTKDEAITIAQKYVYGGIADCTSSESYGAYI